MNFVNCSAFAKVMIKSQVYCFFETQYTYVTHGNNYIICYLCLNKNLIYDRRTVRRTIMTMSVEILSTAAQM